MKPEFLIPAGFIVCLLGWLGWINQASPPTGLYFGNNMVAERTLDFCDGWRQGFTAAYCSGHQFCTSAPVPACPTHEGSFADGYSAGYDAGERVHPPH